MSKTVARNRRKMEKDRDSMRNTATIVYAHEGLPMYISGRIYKILVRGRLMEKE